MKQVDGTLKKAEERSQKTTELQGGEIRDLQWRMDELRRKCENDIQYMDSKLSMIDDSAVMRKWVTAQIQGTKTNLEDQLKDVTLKLTKTLKTDLSTLQELSIPILLDTSSSGRDSIENSDDEGSFSFDGKNTKKA